MVDETTTGTSKLNRQANDATRQTVDPVPGRSFGPILYRAVALWEYWGRKIGQTAHLAA